MENDDFTQLVQRIEMLNNVSLKTGNFELISSMADFADKVNELLDPKVIDRLVIEEYRKLNIV